MKLKSESKYAASVPKYYQRLFHMLVSLFLIAAIFSIGALVQMGVNVDTSIKSVAPAITDNRAISDGINRISSYAENRFLLVLVANSETELEVGSDAIRAHLRELSPTFYVDQSSEFSTVFSDFIKKNQFHLLTTDQRKLLTHATDSEITEAARRRFYDFSAALSILPVHEDPMGYASEFLLQITDAFGSALDEEIGKAKIDGQEKYFLPIPFRVKGDALDIVQQTQFINELDSTVKEIQTVAPDIIILASGIVFFASDAAIKSREDIGLISAGSIVGITILIIVVFRSFRPLLLSIISVLFGIGMAFIFSHLIFRSIHVLTIVFGSSLIGVVVDYSLHYFYITMRADSSRSLSGLYRALFFSLVTSIVGYSALSLSGLEILREVAFFSIFGLISAWLVVMTLGPILQDSHATAGSIWPTKISRGLLNFASHIRRPVVFVILSAILVSAAVLSTKTLQQEDGYPAFFRLDPKLAAQEKAVDELIRTHEPGTYLVVEGADDQEVYERIQDVTGRFGDVFFGIHRFIPSPEEQRDIYNSYSRLYGSNGLAYAFLTGLKADKSSSQTLRDRYLSADRQTIPGSEVVAALGQWLPLFWTKDNGVTYSILMVPKSIELSSLQDHVRTTEGLSVIRISEASSIAVKDLREAATRLLAVAVILIGLLVVIRYRKLQALALLLVPVTSIATCLVFFSVLSVPISLFHVMAMFLVLGLGMDYVIFISELSEDRVDTTVAILLSATTSLLSFGLLSLSSLPLVSAFGLTVLLGNSFNLAGAIIFSAGGFGVGLSTADLN